MFRPICASPLTPPNATSEINRHAARHAVECYVVYSSAKILALHGRVDSVVDLKSRRYTGQNWRRDAAARTRGRPAPRPSRQLERSAACSAARPGRAARLTCVEINQLSSRRRVDGVEDDAKIQHERAVKF